MTVSRAFAAFTAFVLAACTELGAPVVPEDIEIVSSAVQVGIVGNDVEELPAVRLLDAAQAPARGVTVTWTVMAGNGTVGNATSVTNSNGVATVSQWTLGTTSGLNRLRASSSSLEVEFQAVAEAGTPTSMQIAGGNFQSVFAGQIVPVDPLVRLVDQYGNGTPEVPVTFSVFSGGGIVSGGVQETDEDGFATPTSWRVGAEGGTNILRATSQGLQAVQFSATANISSRCLTATTYIIPSTVLNALSPEDCMLPDQFYYDFFSALVSGGTQIIRFDMQSSTFDAFLFIGSSAGELLADDDDGAAQGSTNSRLTLIAAPGQYEIAASSAFEFEEGSYSLSSSILPSINAQCGQDVYIMRGVTINQSLGGGDCVIQGGPFFADKFIIFLSAGVPMTVTMSSTALDPYLEILVLDGEVPLVENNDISGTDFNARITFTPTSSGYYEIWPSSFFANEVGAYTLTIAAGAGGDVAGLTSSPSRAPHAWLLDRVGGKRR